MPAKLSIGLIIGYYLLSRLRHSWYKSLIYYYLMLLVCTNRRKSCSYCFHICNIYEFRQSGVLYPNADSLSNTISPKCKYHAIIIRYTMITVIIIACYSVYSLLSIQRLRLPAVRIHCLQYLRSRKFNAHNH